MPAVKSPAKCRSKALCLLQPLRKYREPKENLAALDYAERTSEYQAAEDLGTTLPSALHIVVCTVRGNFQFLGRYNLGMC